MFLFKRQLKRERTLHSFIVLVVNNYNLFNVLFRTRIKLMFDLYNVYHI